MHVKNPACILRLNESKLDDIFLKTILITIKKFINSNTIRNRKITWNFQNLYIFNYYNIIKCKRNIDKLQKNSVLEIGLKFSDIGFRLIRRITNQNNNKNSTFIYRIYFLTCAKNIFK